MLENLRIVAEAAGFSEPQSLPELIGAIIGTFLSLLGIIFLILIMYGGFVWMTSGGNETKVYRAKKILTNSVVGMVIILCSYAITRFVFEMVQGSI